MKELTLDGLTVQIEYKAVKNLTIRVRMPERVVCLTVPKHMGEKRALAFVREKRAWIDKRLAIEVPPKPQFITGETAVLLGTPYRVQVGEAEKRARAYLDGDRLVLLVPIGTDESGRKALVDALAKKLLAERIERLAPECEATVGKRASLYRIRDMVSRWGTCNTATKAVTINLRLAYREERFLRYILIHELTHLYEANHSERFYRYMDRFCPEWRQLRKELKQGGI